MVDKQISTLDVLFPDLEALWEAYTSIARFSPSYPSFYSVYSQYTTIMDGRRSTWEAQFYPDTFYDGTPGKSARRIMPDFLSGNNDPFRIMDISVVRSALNYHQMMYSIKNQVFNAAVVGVW
jgi:hypothetical protein